MGFVEIALFYDVVFICLDFGWCGMGWSLRAYVMIAGHGRSRTKRMARKFKISSLRRFGWEFVI
jgi:hypothetical protein